jgi:hypothetical protein
MAKMPDKMAVSAIAGLYCLDCIGEVLSHQAQVSMGNIPEGTPEPEPEFAITLAPSWQMKSVMGQQILACVAVPACMRHLTATVVSPVEKAVMGGKLLPGRSN